MQAVCAGAGAGGTNLAAAQPYVHGRLCIYTYLHMYVGVPSISQLQSCSCYLVGTPQSRRCFGWSFPSLPNWRLGTCSLAARPPRVTLEGTYEPTGTVVISLVTYYVCRRLTRLGRLAGRVQHKQTRTPGRQDARWPLSARTFYPKARARAHHRSIFISHST